MKDNETTPEEAPVAKEAPSVSLGTMLLCYQILTKVTPGGGKEAIQLGQALLEMENFIRFYQPEG